jgi:serine phosphatase RsbU (regulator of sigma subunit)
MNYYFKLINLADSAKFPHYYAYGMYGLGWIECVQKKKFDKIHYLERSFNIYQKLKDTIQMVMLLNGISKTYMTIYVDDTLRQKNLDKAIEYDFLALDLIKDKNKFYFIKFQALLDIASLLTMKKNYDSSMKIIRNVEKENISNYRIKTIINYFKFINFYKTGKFDSCMNIIKKYDHNFMKNTVENTSEYLLLKYNIFKHYRMYKEAVVVMDSLYQRKIQYFNNLLNSRSEELEYSKKLMNKELSIYKLENQNKIEKLKNKQKNIFFIILSVILIFSVVFLFISINQNRKIKKLNTDLHFQKNLVEKKNVEITQSINYAFRIQSALLLQEKNFSQLIFLHEYFIIYMPKDIVSGDFYWTHHKNNGAGYIGVFDCTGHGVPGAFMSLLNINLLNEAVKTRQLEFPDEIFNYVRSQLTLLLNLDEYQKDGMDGTLLYFPADFHSSKNFFYASANNPFYLVHNGNLMISETDKFPIGKSHILLPFRKYSQLADKNSKVYLASDGFKDQFGGEKNKKFGNKALKQLLIECGEKNSSEQKQFILTAFHQWKKQYEQTDDVCLIGFRIG